MELNKRALAGLIMSFISIILMIISLSSDHWYHCESEIPTQPWNSSSDPYSYEQYTIDMEYKIEGEYGLREGEVKSTIEINMPQQSNSVTTSSSGDLTDNMKRVGNLTMVLVILSLIGILGFMITGVMASLGALKSMIPLLIGLGSVALLLFVTIYFPLAFSQAMEEDSKEHFYVSGDQDIVYYNEGSRKIAEDFNNDFVESGKVGSSYYLVIMSLILMIIASFFFLGVKKPDKTSISMIKNKETKVRYVNGKESLKTRTLYGTKPPEAALLSRRPNLEMDSNGFEDGDETEKNFGRKEPRKRYPVKYPKNMDRSEK